MKKESFTETILDNISSGLLTVDMQNRIVYFRKKDKLLLNGCFQRFNRRWGTLVPR